MQMHHRCIVMARILMAMRSGVVVRSGVEHLVKTTTQSLIKCKQHKRHKQLCRYAQRWVQREPLVRVKAGAGHTTAARRFLQHLASGNVNASPGQQQHAPHPNLMPPLHGGSAPLPPLEAPYDNTPVHTTDRNAGAGSDLPPADATVHATLCAGAADGSRVQLPVRRSASVIEAPTARHLLEAFAKGGGHKADVPRDPASVHGQRQPHTAAARLAVEPQAATAQPPMSPTAAAPRQRVAQQRSADSAATPPAAATPPGVSASALRNSIRAMHAVPALAIPPAKPLVFSAESTPQPSARSRRTTPRRSDRSCVLQPPVATEPSALDLPAPQSAGRDSAASVLPGVALSQQVAATGAQVEAQAGRSRLRAFRERCASRFAKAKANLKARARALRA